MLRLHRTRRGKYDAQKTTVDNIRFHSKKEANRYGELKMLQLAGAIRGLELQVKYPLIVHNHLICSYVADFRYDEHLNGSWLRVVEDTKGYRTREYRLKKKLMLAIHGIEIREH